MSQKKQSQQEKNSLKRYLLLGVVVSLVIVAKVMPYLLGVLGWNVPVDQTWSYFWNFSPLIPLAIVAGATLTRKWAILLTVLTWLAGDLGIWAITGHFEWAFYPMQPFIYLMILMVVLIGEIGTRWGGQGAYLFQSSRNLLSGVVGATLFFLLTNFLIWAFGSEAIYPYTLGGLIECYTLAIPFYRNSLIGVAIYVPVLTGLMSLSVTETTAAEANWKLAEKA